MLTIVVRDYGRLSISNLRVADYCVRSPPPPSPSPPAYRPKPSGVLPIPARLAPKGIVGGVGGGREGRPGLQAGSLRREGARGQQMSRVAPIEQPRQVARQPSYASDSRRADSGVRVGTAGSGDAPGSGHWTSHAEVGTGAGRGNADGSRGWQGGKTGSGGDGRGVIGNGSGSKGGASEVAEAEARKVAATDETFGTMAPCWRLLERAKAYMEQVRIAFMRCSRECLAHYPLRIYSPEPALISLGIVLRLVVDPSTRVVFFFISYYFLSVTNDFVDETRPCCGSQRGGAG